MSYTHVFDGSGKLRLADVDPNDTSGLKKDEAGPRLDALGKELGDLHDLLFFAGRHALLVVLQGRDTSGKDGTIRRILEFSNAQSCRVEPFKVPTPLELGHDFLWRIHARTPARGSIAIFNRSHYEDVLVVRVHKLVPENVWRPRYDQINQFEALLAHSDTIIAKFYLHISKDEQAERLLAREEDTEKAWKLSVGDWKERERWDDYSAAYDEALNRCGTPAAPWYVVPANRKWFRDVAVLDRLVELLRPYKAGWLESLDTLGKKARAELAAYRSGLK